MKPVRGHIDGEYQDGELRGLVFLAGKRGMGKTTETCRLIGKCTGNVLFFDALSRHRHLLPTYVLVSQPGQLKSVIRAAAANRKVFRVIYQPMRGSRLAHFEAVNKILKETAKALGGVMYAVDEVDRVCKVSDDADAPKMPPELKEIVEYGRHFWISMLFTARKPPAVPRGLTSECGEVRLFRTTENRYVKYWVDTIGDDHAGDVMRKLPKYHYLLCRDGEDGAIYTAGRLVRAL